MTKQSAKISVSEHTKKAINEAVYKWGMKQYRVADEAIEYGLKVMKMKREAETIEFISEEQLKELEIRR